MKNIEAITVDGILGEVPNNKFGRYQFPLDVKRTMDVQLDAGEIYEHQTNSRLYINVDPLGDEAALVRKTHPLVGKAVTVSFIKTGQYQSKRGPRDNFEVIAPNGEWAITAVAVDEPLDPDQQAQIGEHNLAR
jgi:hypothetical protein